MSWEDALTRLVEGAQNQSQVSGQDAGEVPGGAARARNTGNNSETGLLEWRPFGQLAITPISGNDFILGDFVEIGGMATDPYGYYTYPEDGDNWPAAAAEKIAVGLNTLWLALADFIGGAAFLAETDYNATAVPGSLAVEVSRGVLLAGAFPTWMFTRDDADRTLDNTNIDDGDIAPSTTNYFFKYKDGRWAVRDTNTPPVGSMIAFSAPFDATEMSGAPNQNPTGRVNLLPYKSLVDEVVAARGAQPDLATRLVNLVGEREQQANVTTADATVTTLLSFVPADGYTTLVTVRVAARKSDGTLGAAYELLATFRRTGAIVTQIGATAVTATMEEASNAAWDATVDTDGTNVRVRVTGAAATTIHWRARTVTVEVT